LALNFNPWAKFQTFRHVTPQFCQVNSNTEYAIAKSYDAKQGHSFYGTLIESNS